MALRAKTRPDEAEFEGFGGSKSENENEVWADFRRNPKGRDQFSPLLRQSSLANTGMRHSSFFELRKIGFRRHCLSSVSRP
jgi:hypothetical protein